MGLSFRLFLPIHDVDVPEGWRIMRNLLSRAMPLALAGVVVLGVVGAAMGGNLPFGMQKAISETAAEIGVDMPSPSTTNPFEFRITPAPSAVASDRVVDVHEAIDEYRAALESWKTCIATAAPQRGGGQVAPTDDPQSRGNPAAECEPKPRLDVPRPADDHLTTEQTRPDRGKPDDTGRPDQPGKSNRP